MRVLVFGDCHWSTYSSILRKRGETYSFRLHNLINSINWLEKYANDNNVDFIVGLGDFFDKETLNSEEITALTEIKWSDIPHYLLIGNHEMGRNDLFYSSTQIFNKHNFYIIDKPLLKYFCNTTTNIIFLPYTLNPNKSIIDNVRKNCNNQKTIIFSHNDIAGIQLGQFVSKAGFEIEDIEKSCDLFINGHLHNGLRITDKIINLGNLTGQNFSEDAFKYSHNIMILDTDLLSYELIENPYAINFYKIDGVNSTPTFNKLKQNSVLTLKSLEKDVSYYEEEIKKCCNIIEYRILIEKEILKDTIDNINSNEFITDHIVEFKNYVLENIGTSDLILEELEEVCR